MQENVVKKSKQCKINGISIWRIIAYLIIYSVIGYVVETIYGIITKGQWESRQSFLYGPFCGIYGLGATILIISLQNFKQSNHKLFWVGFIVGSVIEYAISLIGELIFNIKWWDYSDRAFNINGRVCVTFSIFWGLLSIYLMTYLNPRVDRIINFIKSKISLKILKVVVVVTTIVIVFDILLTGYSLQMFTIRIVHDNNLNVKYKQEIDKKYEQIYIKDTKQAEFIYKYFGNKKMIRTFPNIKIKDVEGNILYYDNYVGDIQPYYYKFK